jgi:hypothetical protein
MYMESEREDDSLSNGTIEPILELVELLLNCGHPKLTLAFQKIILSIPCPRIATMRIPNEDDNQKN